MDRRKFIKVVGLGAMAFYLSGSGLVATEKKKESAVSAQGSVSGGQSYENCCDKQQSAF